MRGSANAASNIRPKSYFSSQSTTDSTGSSVSHHSFNRTFGVLKATPKLLLCLQNMRQVLFSGVSLDDSLVEWAHILRHPHYGGFFRSVVSQLIFTAVAEYAWEY